MNGVAIRSYRRIAKSSRTLPSSPAAHVEDQIPFLPSGTAGRQWARSLGVRAATTIVSEFSQHQPPFVGAVDVVDLFCGCGGMSAGFDFISRLVPSYRLAGAVDIDLRSISTYGHNLPVQPIAADLAQSTSAAKALDELVGQLGLRKGNPLVLIGGPPCQGFSAHRKKDGVNNDERNNLVRAFAKIVAKLNPDFVVFENVPEVLAKKHWRYFLAMRAVLKERGFIVRAQIHNLAGFGVPQERFRTLVLASRKPFEMPQAFLSPPQYRTVRDAIGRLSPVEPGETSDDSMHYCTRHRQNTVEVIRRVPKNGGRRPQGVGPKCLDRVDGFRDVYGRMYWERPANTITAYARNPASGRYVHPEQDRGLTIREAALLQGFPAGFEFLGPFDHKFLQIGNAVPPVFAAYLAAHVLGELLSTVPPGDNERDGIVDVFAPTSNSYSSGIAGRKKGTRR